MSFSKSYSNYSKQHFNHLIPTFDPLKQFFTESWQHTKFISMAHDTKIGQKEVNLFILHGIINLN